MKSKALFFLCMMMLVLVACGKDEPSVGGQHGSPRDWTYTNVDFQIDGVKITSVSEITCDSRQIVYDPVPEDPYFPWYAMTLKVKGLEKKNKVTNIYVDADVDRFEGEVTLSGVDYDVTGYWIGNPFSDLPENTVIVVNLTSRK